MFEEETKPETNPDDGAAPNSARESVNQEPDNTAAEPSAEQKAGMPQAQRPAVDKAKIAFIAERKKRQATMARLDELERKLAERKPARQSDAGAEQDNAAGTEIKSALAAITKELAELKNSIKADAQASRHAELEAKAEKMLAEDTSLSVDDVAEIYDLIDERLHAINPAAAMSTAIRDWKEKSGLSEAQKKAAQANKDGAPTDKGGTANAAISGGSVAELERQILALDMKKPEDRQKYTAIMAKLKQKGAV